MTDRLSVIVAEYVLGDLLPARLPDIGTELLSCGYDSPSLRRLASSSPRQTSENLQQFVRAIDELQARVPMPHWAALLVAVEIAKNIVAGTLDPYNGARAIWSRLYVKFPELHQLRPFVAIAGEIEDDDTLADQGRQAIVAAARKLVEEYDE